VAAERRGQRSFTKTVKRHCAGRKFTRKVNYITVKDLHLLLLFLLLLLLLPLITG